MIGLPRDFYFAEAHNILHLLWLIPLIFLFFLSEKLTKKSTDNLIFSSLQPFVITSQTWMSKKMHFIFFIGGWFFATLALMRPLGNEYYINEPQNKVNASDVYLMIDTSLSMSVKDTSHHQTRLDIAKQIADDFIAKNPQNLMGLFSLSNGLHALAPLTSDHIFLRLMVRDLQFNEGDLFGTNFKKWVSQINQEDTLSKNSIVILFSDGEDTELSKNKNYDELFKNETLNDITLFTVGIGSQNGGEVPGVTFEGKKVISKLDSSLLKILSEKTGGTYFDAQNIRPNALASVLTQAIQRKYSNVEFQSQLPLVAFKDYFQIPLFISILLFFLAFWLPKKSTSFIFLFLFPTLSFSAEEGALFFEAGEFQESINWYTNELRKLPPNWLQDKLFYNLATAYAAQEKWENALQFYSAISGDVYNQPVFFKRLLYNQVFCLWKLGNIAKKGLQPFYYLEALWLMWSNPTAVDKELQALIQNSLTNLNLEITQFPFRTYLYTMALIPSLTPAQKQAINFLLMPYSNLKNKIANASPIVLNDLSLSINRNLKSNQPKEKLQFLINETLINKQRQHIGIDKKQQLSFIRNAQNFYPFLYRFQENEFEKGKCQCFPWNQVIPYFSSGLLDMQASLSFLTSNEKKAFAYLMSGFWEWQNALEAFEVHQTQNQESLQMETKEIQEMESLDKELIPKMDEKQMEGKPW